MGLLTDTFDLYKKQLEKLQGIDNTGDDFSGMDSDFNRSGDGFKTSLRDRKSPLMDNPIFPPSIIPPGQGKVNIGDKSIPVIPKNMMSKKNIPAQDASANIPEVKINTEAATQLGNDNNFLGKLANLAGIDMNKASATWKDKGGFDGLMSNPAFTLGLAFIQAGANGKTIGQGALDNVLKAGVISQQYKDRLKAKSEILEVTASDVADMKEELKNYDIFEPNAFEQFFGKAFSLGKKDPQKAYDKAAELFALEYKKEARKMAEAAGQKGKDFVIDSSTRKRIIEKVIKTKKAKVKENLIPFLKGTVEAPQESYTLNREHGGPVHQGKPYIVGEAGPEIMIPHSSGNVIANDDSQVFSMLLASNPQLQKVSKERAMKILKAKFPEYFD